MAKQEKRSSLEAKFWNDKQKIDKNTSLMQKIEKIFNSNEDIKLCKKEIYELLSVLHKIKILDPACGSGAFPIGI